ncbi:hypothetical protein MG7_04574 [Candida albicans P34048]|nr:hypothetical protein MG7_04574 [Candida albicans P34048]
MTCVFMFIMVILIFLFLLKTQVTKLVRFAFIGIPMITGITLALFILKIMSTSREMVDID